MMDLYKAPAAKYPRVPGGMNGHIANFVDGCQNGTPTSSNFEKAGKLTETVLMGNLAVKAYQYKELQPGKTERDWNPYNSPGRRKLMWDGENMRITNYEKANEWVTRDYREGWELE
jgi:hypothetical protein